MFPVKSGLVSNGQKRPAPSWARAKPEKQAHHSAARLSSLPHPHPHAARQQTGCPSTNKKTHHLSPTLLFPPAVDTDVPAVVETPAQGTAEPTMRQRHTGLFSRLDAWKLKFLTSFREQFHLRNVRALESWGCHFLLEIWNTIWTWWGGQHKYLLCNDLSESKIHSTYSKLNRL